MPISLGLLCPNPGFRPHPGLSYPSGPLVPIQSGVITPSSCRTWTFVLSQQACELGILLNLVWGGKYVDDWIFLFFSFLLLLSMKHVTPSSLKSWSIFSFSFSFLFLLSFAFLLFSFYYLLSSSWGLRGLGLKGGALSWSWTDCVTWLINMYI